MAEIRILPGTPDDDNREYLPEIIRTTDIVVNENGNNSIVYPKRLQEFKGVVTGDEKISGMNMFRKAMILQRRFPL